MIEIVKFMLRIFFGIFFRFEIVGRENIPEKGAALLCANHNGELDMFFIGCKIRRLIHWMAKAELFKNPAMSYFLNEAGAFPVKRGSGDVGAIKTAMKLLKEGHIVGMFLQGTRTRGKAVDAKPGGALVAIKTNVPILPVAIEGKYKLFGRVRVVFGKPYMLKAEEGKKYSNEELTEISENIMSKIYSLVEAK